MERKRFAAVAIILIVVIVLIVGGIWYYELHKSATTVAQTETSTGATTTTTAVATASTGAPISSTYSASTTSNWNTYANQQYGFEIGYPPIGESEYIVPSTGTAWAGSETWFDFVESPSGATYNTHGMFNVSVITNVDHLSLIQWLEKNIDINEMLLDNGNFVTSSYEGGELASLRMPLPEDYLNVGDPIGFDYALISPTGNSIYLIGLDQDAEFPGYSIDYGAFIDQVFSTFHFLPQSGNSDVESSVVSSSLTIDFGMFSQLPPQHSLVTDPAGREIGYDGSPNGIQNIPQSSYFDSDNGEVSPTITDNIVINDSIDGTYTISAPGGSVPVVTVVHTDGTEEGVALTPTDVTASTTYVYQLQLSTGPGTQSTLDLIR